MTAPNNMSTHIAYAYHCLRRHVSNFSLVKRRHFDGMLISMHQSGTHWLKHMLASALTDKYGLPAPQYIHANDVIAGPKDKRLSDVMPHLVSAHSIPHALFRSKLFHSHVSLPPYVVLVRDIRASLVSNYEKWKDHYACEFEEFLLGDVSGQRFNNDIWWCIRFFNRWGEVIFQTNDVAAGWDGRTDGGRVASPMGVYAWRVICWDATAQPKEHSYMGHVTLVR